jgi:hypothetical protein
MNKKNLIAFAVAGLGFGAIQGCSVDQGASYEPEDDVGVTESALTGAGSMTIVNDWGNGYCASVKLTNGLPEATAKWRVIMDLKSTTITSSWNVSISGNSGMSTMTPVSYNTVIGKGQTVEYGFCANAPNAWTRPVMKAWNMTTTVYADCSTQGGANPTKAALAVAMATELGRWDPVADLTVTNNAVALSSDAFNRCNTLSHKCKNTKALLGQQADGATTDQNLFNPTNFREDLKASFGRHNDNIANLNRNNRAALPVAHNLTLVSGPTNIGQVQNGVSKSCGPHYIYKVTKTNGANLSTTERNNLGHALLFYGGAAVGGNAATNPYVGYTTTGLAGCPSGATCIAIDPTDGDNGSTSTTSAGSAPTYPMNRVQDTIPSMLGQACIRTNGALASLISKCAASPNTCGTLYCQ